jgi:hypothetical protein
MDVLHNHQHVSPCANTLSHKQCQAFNIILQHSQKKITEPLMMIIQGTIGIGKYYLISCIKASLNAHSPMDIVQYYFFPPLELYLSTYKQPLYMQHLRFQ